MKNKILYQSIMSFGLCLCINLAFGQLSNYFAGNNAGGSNSGTFCTGVGSGSITNGNSGIYNSGFGSSALGLNTFGERNTATGAYALYHNSTGDRNAALGNHALYYNSTGSNNTAHGSNALYFNEIGSYNAAFGYEALYTNVSGNNSTAIGYQALYKNINGNNTAVGSHALFNNEIGIDNTAVGTNTMLNMNSGIGNTSLGADALYQATSGNGNTALGKKAGYARAKYTNCTLLGNEADATASAFSNAIAIGYKAKVDGSNKVRVGNTSITSIGGQVGWTTLSDLRLKENISKSKLGLDFILNLHPVTYNYKDENQKGILYTGLIAQEVDAAAKKEGVDFSGVDKNGEYWGIRYGDLTVPLIKAVQEMNEKNEQLAISNVQLKKENQALQNEIADMRACLETLCANASTERANSQQLEANSFLNQNNPNPFKENTTIGFNISSASGKGMLKIFSMNGEEIKSIVITTRGKGQIEIAGNTFAPGVYTYVLIVDDRTVDTKQMVVTR